MQISYDPEKRRITLERRGLDFDHAPQLFAGVHYNNADTRYDYGEDRWISVGVIETIPSVVVWTEREDSRRIISMRKADKDEREEYHRYLE